MWSQEEGEEVVEKEQDLPFLKDRAVGCTLNLPLILVLFLCWDALYKGLVFFSFPDNKSCKIEEKTGYASLS